MSRREQIVDLLGQTIEVGCLIVYAKHAARGIVAELVLYRVHSIDAGRSVVRAVALLTSEQRALTNRVAVLRHPERAWVVRPAPRPLKKGRRSP